MTRHWSMAFMMVLLTLSMLTSPATAQIAGNETAPDRAKAGTRLIEGVVTFRGDIPKSPIADNEGVRRDLLQVDRATRGLQNVVVWIDAPARSPETNAPAAAMDQQDHEFVPRVLAVRAGQPVRFSNSDPANHNVHAGSPQPTNEFNVFTGTDHSYTRPFAPDPQQRPVRVSCDIHPWMRGWIYVFEHPHFAVTDERGRFQIDGVPPGRYTLHYRQPDIRSAGERNLEIGSARTVPVQIELAAEQPERTPRPK